MENIVRKAEVKFILTRELGRLAKWLRILGYDTIYFYQANSGSLLIQALREDRIILTRNHRLSRPGGAPIVMVRSEILKEQIGEVLKQLHIEPRDDIMFSLCVICNTRLIPVSKEKVKDKVPEYVFSTQEDFITCPSCNRVYWQGTHWGNVKEMLKEIGLS